jgi:hypothetical protein
VERFKKFDLVTIIYPNQPWFRRTARVVEDDGGPTATVEWTAKYPDRGRPGRRRAYYPGKTHAQKIPRERLKPRPVI